MPREDEDRTLRPLLPEDPVEDRIAAGDPVGPRRQDLLVQRDQPVVGQELVVPRRVGGRGCGFDAARPASGQASRRRRKVTIRFIMTALTLQLENRSRPCM
jgi:hypothetical protein